MKQQTITILGIETSCDDTAIAILEIKKKKFKVLSNIVSSQSKIHAQYGGVYPLLAKREHKKNLPIVLEQALKKAKNPKLDLIAVTIGPGLEPCLWQGINFAKELAKNLDIPLIPVNHIEAHIFANFIKNQILKPEQIFPAICLIASGGHTQLILIKKWEEYEILGETLDDAAGECFDKTARILGLRYPGGPAIEAQASQYKSSKLGCEIKLPRPMIHKKTYNFSFSGLKTAVLYHYQKQDKKTQKSKKYIKAMAKEVQNAIIDVLMERTFRAAQNYRVKSIILGGGVTANKELRKRFQKEAKKLKLRLLLPDKKQATDNALMVAVAGYYNWLKQEKKKVPIEAKANLRLK